MKDVVLTLRMCLGDETGAPEGPGWYIYAQGETTLIPPVRVAPQAADIIARGFEQVIMACPPGTMVHATPRQIVGSGNKLVHQKLRQELDAAEAAAQRIAPLRMSLQAIEEASGTIDSEPERQENPGV